MSSAQCLTEPISLQQDAMQELPRLIDSIRRRLAARFGDPELIDDALQEAVLQICQRDQVAHPDLGAYLVIGTRHRALNMLRRQRRERARHQLWHDVMLQRRRNREAEVPGLGEDDPERALQALHALPEHHREAVTLVHMQGLSHGQAAATLNITTTVLRGRLQRGMKKLRMQLMPLAA